jgi:hypothetical protein
MRTPARRDSLVGMHDVARFRIVQDHHAPLVIRPERLIYGHFLCLSHYSVKEFGSAQRTAAAAIEGRHMVCDIGAFSRENTATAVVGLLQFEQ